MIPRISSHIRFVRPRHFFALAVALAAALGPAVARAVVHVPSDFVNETVVSNLDEPASFAFLPDGRLLLIEQRTGKVRLVVDDHIASTDPVLEVPSVESVSGERGLLGIAVDPEWPVRPFVYFMHSRQGGATRIVRYLASDDVDVPHGENLTFSAPRILIDDIPDQFGNHNGGTLRFGPDGHLYASIGDDAVYCDATDSTTLRGEILRLRVSTLPIFGASSTPRWMISPYDNPMASSPDSNARLVYAYGLRNPFRFHIDPWLGTLYVADVGLDTEEEMDEVESGDFLGWPWREGEQVVPINECPEPGGMGATACKPPIAVIPHDDAIGYAIISAGVYRPAFGGANNWPPDYWAGRGDVFYNQYYEGVLRRIRFNGTSWEPAAPVAGQPTPTAWADGMTSCVDYLVGPDGSMWWMRQFDDFFRNRSGSLNRIRFVGNSLSVPEAPGGWSGLQVSPNPARGAIDVSFALPAPRRARLGVFDLSGRRVRRLLDGEVASGETHIRWDGNSDAGDPSAAGVYFLRLELPGSAPFTTRVLRLR